MDEYLKQFISGIEEQAAKNDGVVSMNKWVHNLAFDALPLSSLLT